MPVVRRPLWLCPRARRQGEEKPFRPRTSETSPTPHTTNIGQRTTEQMNDHEHGMSTLNRRAFLGRSSIGLGSIALASLLDPRLLTGALEADAPSWRSHGAIDRFHVRPRAQRVIFLYMSG